jgi:hypothetical protein
MRGPGEELTMPGFGTRVAFAFRAFFSLLFGGRLPDDILDTFRPADVAPARPTPRGEEDLDRAVQVLAILQRDARLVDFLQEDLTAYSDSQVGAAVRDVQTNCRAALARYLTIAPFLDAAEGDRVPTDALTDPGAIRIVGTVSRTTGQTGVVRHRGWHVTSLTLPPLGPAGGRRMIAQAEVEVA